MLKNHVCRSAVTVLARSEVVVPKKDHHFLGHHLLLSYMSYLSCFHFSFDHLVILSSFIRCTFYAQYSFGLYSFSPVSLFICLSTENFNICQWLAIERSCFKPVFFVVRPFFGTKVKVIC